MSIYDTVEGARLLLIQQKKGHWNRWGPFLSERAWGAVREDYGADGNAWDYLPHDHARSRTYRWNEDGLAGICDRHQYLCFALALWNGRDPFLKERLFGPDWPGGQPRRRRQGGIPTGPQTCSDQDNAAPRLFRPVALRASLFTSASNGNARAADRPGHRHPISVAAAISFW